MGDKRADSGRVLNKCVARFRKHWREKRDVDGPREHERKSRICTVVAVGGHVLPPKRIPHGLKLLDTVSFVKIVHSFTRRCKNQPRRHVTTEIHEMGVTGA
jgi:hypothetical protein